MTQNVDEREVRTEGKTNEWGRRALLGVVAAAAAQPLAAQECGGGPQHVRVSPPFEVNPGFRARLAVFNSTNRSVRVGADILDVMTGSFATGQHRCVPVTVVEPRRGAFRDVVFPTSAMPAGTSWELMALFVFHDNPRGIVTSVEVRDAAGNRWIDGASSLAE